MEKKDVAKIKTGWDRLDKETQTKLKKQGIHPLQHTPGYLGLSTYSGLVQVVRKERAWLDNFIGA